MTLNTSGPISLAGTTAGVSIENQLGGSGTTQISLNDSAVRTLAGVSSGAITMPTNFYGKPSSSGDPYWTSVSLLTNSANLLSFADASTNNFPITNTGGVAPSLNTPVTGGGSQYFVSGGSDYLTVANSSSLNITGAFTLECWVYLTTTGANSYIFGKGGGGASWSTSNGHEYLLFFDSGSWGWGWNQSGGYANISASAGSVANQWVHLAIGYNGTTTRFWVNGASIGTSTGTYTVPSTNNIVRVGQTPSTDQQMNGFVSNLRWVSGTDVYGVSNSTITVPTAPLTAVSGTSLLINGTNQNTFDNATFYDQSANSFAITPSGSPVYSGLSPFGNAYAGSVYFDGSSYLSVPSVTGLNYSGQFTVELWLYPTQQLTGNGSSGTSIMDGTVNSGFTIQTNASGTQWGVASHLVSYDLFTSTFPTLNAWNHIAISRNSSNIMSLFLNGTRVATATITNNYLNPSNLYIGNGTAYSLPVYGYITNLRCVNGTAVYDPTQSTITSPTTPLTAVTNTSLLLGCDTGAFYDLSNTGNPISQSGSPVVTTQVSPFSSVTESYYFDGSSYQSMGVNTALQLTSTGAFTIEGWVYFSSVASQQYILSNWSVGSNGYAIATGVAGYSNNQLCFFDGSNWRVCSTVVAANTWYYIAVSSLGTSSSANMYLNGVSQMSAFTPSSSINNTGSTFYLGSYTNSTTSALTGYLNNLRITKGVGRYTANFTPPTAPFPTN